MPVAAVVCVGSPIVKSGSKIAISGKIIDEETPFFSSSPTVIIEIGVTSEPVPAVVGTNTNGNLGPLALETPQASSIFSFEPKIKEASLILGSNENIEDAWGVSNAKGPRLPLVLVPTTAGTGSEVTPISIITVGEEEKKGVSSSIILPDIAILDPDLTIGLPTHTTAATGIDAMVHAIEASIA